MDRDFVNNRNTKHKGPLLKIVFVGDSEVGKSTIISTFLVILNNIERLSPQRKV